MCTGNCGGGCNECGDLTLPQGEDGRGIDSMSIVNGNIVVTYTDGTTENIGAFAEDWASITNAQLTSRTFTGSDGCALVGTLASDAVIEFAYNILSPYTAALVGFISFSIDLDRTASGFDFGTFNLNLRFPAFSSTVFYSGTKKFTTPFSTAPVNYETAPVAVRTQLAGDDTYNNGAGFMSLSNNSGDNRIIITCHPNLPNVNGSGIYSVNLAFNCTYRIA